MTNWKNLETAVSSQGFLSHNPVVEALKSSQMNPEQGFEVLRQYYYLVVFITQYLTITMSRVPDAKAKQELLRNIGEELGSRTNGISHQELFELLLKKELGINVRTPWNPATQEFISSVLVDCHVGTARYVAGIAYALEATASPELIVVGHIINLAAQRQVVNIARLTGNTDEQTNENYRVATLEDFLASHTLSFEIGHESGLRTTLEKFISEDWTEFEDGFYRVLTLMQIWWDELAKA